MGLTPGFHITLPLTQVRVNTFHFCMIPALPENVNSMDLMEVKIMDTYMFTYGHENRNSFEPGMGLMHNINHCANINYYDTERGYCLHAAGFAYEQCTLIGFLDEQTHEIFESLKPLFPGPTRTAVIAIDLRASGREILALPPAETKQMPLYIHGSDYAELMKINNREMDERFKRLWQNG